MASSSAAPALASGVAALAIIALVVVIVLFALPGKNGGGAATAASLGQAQTNGQADEDGQAQEKPPATPLPSRLSSAFPGAPYYRDPRDADPYWWPRPLWGRDIYNRDPVCYGDPACRDAYFRDWPWARRPYHKPSSGPQPPINVTVTAPSTSTATNTVTLPPPPPPAPAPEPAPAPVPESAPEPVLIADDAGAPTEAVVDIAGVEDSAGAVRASVRSGRGGSGGGLAARLKRAAGKVAGKVGFAAHEAPKPQAAGACRSCRLGATTPAPSYDAVFPPTMDRSSYAL